VLRWKIGANLVEVAEEAETLFVARDNSNSSNNNCNNCNKNSNKNSNNNGNSNSNSNSSNNQIGNIRDIKRSDHSQYDDLFLKDGMLDLDVALRMGLASYMGAAAGCGAGAAGGGGSGASKSDRDFESSCFVQRQQCAGTGHFSQL